MNKRNIAQLVIFIAIVFVGDRIGGEIMERLFMKSDFRYSMLYKSALEADIVILGNSRGLHMFHPPAIESVTGHEVANLAFNALPTVAMPVVWEDYLQQHKPPKLLVLEISCIGTFDKAGAMEQFSVLIDQNSQYAELIRETNSKFYYATKLSRLYRYNSPLLWRSAMFLKKSDQSWIMNSQLNQEAMQQTIQESDATLLRSDANVAAIARVLELAQAHGVEVRLVLAPYFPAYLERLDDVEQWLGWLETELGEPIENHSALIEEPEAFTDHLHLNENGALELAERLNAIEFFGFAEAANAAEAD